MNTVKKRGTALLLALVLSLTACGGGKADPAPAEAPDPAGAQEPTQAPEETQDETQPAQDAAAPAAVPEPEKEPEPEPEPEPKVLPEGPPTCTFENGVLTCSGGGEVSYVGYKPAVENAIFSSNDSEVKAAVEKVVVEWGITSFAKSAFYCCENLKEVSLPDSLELIGQRSFLGTGLTSVEIPDSVKIINATAFNVCKNLSSVKLSANLEYIGESAFAGCESLTSIEIPDNVYRIFAGAFARTGLTECTLPKGLKELGNDIFDESQIKSIIVPEGAVAVNGSFGDCPELTDITFYGNHNMDEINSVLARLASDFEKNANYMVQSGEGTPHVLTIHADAGSTVEGWTNKNISEQGWKYIQFAAN